MVDASQLPSETSCCKCDCLCFPWLCDCCAQSEDEDDEDSAHERLVDTTINDGNSIELYWISFLDGMQRVIAFTTDPKIARRLHRVNSSCLLALLHPGLKLVGA